MALKPADYKTEVHNDWCPGCGDFGILNAIQMSLAELAIPTHKAAIFFRYWVFRKNTSFYSYIWNSYITW
jgi:pyruvate/2-oxoacid:ferredoxin oxidoreductase beta subunit